MFLAINPKGSLRETMIRWILLTLGRYQHIRLRMFGPDGQDLVPWIFDGKLHT